MGYSPKHAKPVSLRSSGLKTHHRPVGLHDTGTGRHRANVGPHPSPEPAGTEPAKPLGRVVPRPRSPLDDS